MKETEAGAEGGEPPDATLEAPPRLERLAIPLIVIGIVGIIAGSLLVTDCTPLTTAVPCTAANDTCLPSGVCPYAPLGVLVLTLAFAPVVAGLVGLWRRRSAEAGPHPEARPRGPAPDTDRTRREREADERRADRPRLRP